ncbi:hypothetical protein XH91_32085 [Bradyrhizobium guangzhouense]|uniref:DUF1488 family protein n=2 Tax=Bradyrhizobium guangzhouense TaxID=1325095 RepID=A0AAE5X695_9BRAD|nr:hypothetical protein XH91_32085 [Bradyrhizobium guangzhouense]
MNHQRGDKSRKFQHCPVRGRERDNCMPLLSDRIIGHDLERLAFRFTMLNDDDVVDCQISDAAMDELAGMQGTESSARQAQFTSLRETIERIASDLYDEAPRFKGYVVRIFVRHLGR